MASSDPLEIVRDQLGYDLAAVFTSPLSVPAATVGPAPSPDDAVTITGCPGGRIAAHVGKVLGYHPPDNGRQWGELAIGVGSHSGDSGGLVACRGLFVGLLWGTRSDGGPRSVAVPIPAIVDFLRRLREKYESLDPEPEDWEGLDQCPPCDLAELRAELAELRELIAAIQVIHGEDGEDGTAGVSPTIDYDELAAKMAPLLPPITFCTIDDSGQEVDRQQIKHGEVLNFHHQIVLPNREGSSDARTNPR